MFSHKVNFEVSRKKKDISVPQNQFICDLVEVLYLFIYDSSLVVHLVYFDYRLVEAVFLQSA